MKKTISVGARASAAWMALACSLAMPPSFAHDMHDMHAPARTAPPPFIASTAKSFDGLMNDAMAAMEYGMASAPMNGNADHDFVAMMIPHHQGAVDMAKAVLLYSSDPEMRNLAQGIVTEQQNEIRLMQLWLQRHQSNPSAAAQPAR